MRVYCENAFNCDNPKCSLRYNGNTWVGFTSDMDKVQFMTWKDGKTYMCETIGVKMVSEFAYLVKKAIKRR